MNATRTSHQPHSRRFTDQEIADAYREAGSVHRAAALIGASHSTVHRRVQKLGIGKSINVFTDAERERLIRDYHAYRDRGDLGKLAAEMGRTKQFICRQAGKLGLTDQSVKKSWAGTWTSKTELELREIFDDFKRSLKSPAEFCKDYGISEHGLWLHVGSRWPDEWEYFIESLWPEDSLYRIGRIFEFKTRDHLLSLGYHATRSNRSSTPADVIAFRQGEMILVQCKTDRHAFPAEEWNELYDIADSTGAVPVLAYPSDGGIAYRRIEGHKSTARWSAQNTIEFAPASTVTRMTRTTNPGPSAATNSPKGG